MGLVVWALNWVGGAVEGCGMMQIGLRIGWWRILFLYFWALLIIIR